MLPTTTLTQKAQLSSSKNWALGSGKVMPIGMQLGGMLAELGYREKGYLLLL